MKTLGCPSVDLSNLADFASAVQVSPASPFRSDEVGVLYWQAPEVRR